MSDCWSVCHTLLEMALDTVADGSGRDSWRDQLADMCQTIAAHTDTRHRWPREASPSSFAVDMHQELDFALRETGARRTARLDRIEKCLACKVKHQHAFTAMVDELAAVARALAATRGGRLDADTADPIVSLRDGLAAFDVRLVKEELRTLLRPDQYRYQCIRTNDNPTLIRFGAMLASEDFAPWQLLGDPSICGSVAQGHPERYTWFLEDAA